MSTLSALRASKEELEQKIQTQGERLNLLNGPDDKRIKKRVLQTLGKLKKQLLEVTSQLEISATEVTFSSDSVNSGISMSEEIDNDDTSSSTTTTSTSHPKTEDIPVWNKKKAKLKLKIVNAEIAELALKKQLKMARKRFNWLSKKGLQPGTFTYSHFFFSSSHFVIFTYINSSAFSHFVIFTYAHFFFSLLLPHI
jgi:hypothetical protein